MTHDHQKTNNDRFILACNDGNLEQVRYWLTSPDLYSPADIHWGDDLGFRLACKNGHLDVVRYLLTSPELGEHVDIHTEQDYGFRWACIQGHLELVRYLLTSSELTEYADIHVGLDASLIAACINGHLPIVRYLLSDPELSEHANIHADDDDTFRWAGAERHLDIMEYLLTFTGEQYIDFQRTEYHLQWAMMEQHITVFQKMCVSLQKNDYIQYIECLPIIEHYCVAHAQQAFYETLRAQERDYSLSSLKEHPIYLHY